MEECLGLGYGYSWAGGERLECRVSVITSPVEYVRTVELTCDAIVETCRFCLIAYQQALQFFRLYQWSFASLLFFSQGPLSSPISVKLPQSTEIREETKGDTPPGPHIIHNGLVDHHHEPQNIPQHISSG
jgi:hypothetical protein